MARQAPHSPQVRGNKVVSAVDWLGNRFAVGEQVIYCISAGRGQMMAIGEVVQIKTEKQFWRETLDCEPDHPDARYWEARNQYYRYVERPYDDVTVQVRTLKTSGRWNNEERKSPAWVNAMNVTALKAVETA
jgi:hypothetical protein